MSANRTPLLTIAVAFLVAIAILLGVLAAVGIDQVLAEVMAANPQILVAILIVALGWIGAWSVSLHVVLTILAVSVSIPRSFLVYTNVLFVNNIAPFSVFGGQPIGAYLVSRATSADYETSLAAVASVAALNYVPAPPLAVLGLLYFALTRVVGQRLEVLAVAVVGLSATLVVVAWLGWHNRHRLEARLISGLLRVGDLLARLIPRIDPLDRVDIERRIGTIVRSLERIAVERRWLAVGVAGSTLGWVLFSSVLWLSLFAVGARVPVGAPLLVVPLATITNLVPLPGGLGTVDGTLVLLVVTTTGVSAATATAAVLIHRGATLLFPILLGVTTTIVIQNRPISIGQS